MEIIKSKYRKAVSFRHGASQRDIVTSDKWKDVDCEEILDSMEEFSDTHQLFDPNPLEFGYFLDTITSKGIKAIVFVMIPLPSLLYIDVNLSFIGKVDCQTGIVLYKQPENDSYVASKINVI